MKISQKQANLLAAEVHQRLLSENTFKLAPELLQKIKSFKKYRDKLHAEKDRISEEIDKHDRQLKDIVGAKNISKIRGYWDEDNIIQKLEEGNTPTISEIEDKIILKAMFSDENDMEAFVDRLVKDFSHKATKKQSK